MHLLHHLPPCFIHQSLSTIDGRYQGLDGSAGGRPHGHDGAKVFTSCLLIQRYSCLVERLVYYI